jgi:hypothetical protein
VGDWLTQDFWFLGLRLQDWMPVAFLIVMLFAAYAWWDEQY